jgi:aminopeptidase N
VITYEKGAWIFHMLRRRLGDEKFLAMLKELRRRFEFQAVSTSDLQELTKEFRPPGMSSDSVDLFFENWVLATGVPSLRLRYNVSGRAPAVQLSGTIEQENVTADFSVEAPLEIQFPGGQRQTVWLRTGDQAQRFSVMLPQAPSKVSLANNTILANTR